MTQGRPPRLLWANLFCLLDISSGASMSVRQMLLQLRRAGWDVAVLGATIFDNERGVARLADQWPSLRGRAGRFVDVEDGPLKHRLFVTRNTDRSEMTSREESGWYSGYLQTLDQFRPDVLFYYGGQPFDFLLTKEAHWRGMKTAFYLTNGNYAKDRWCRDVDLVITDTQATADLYRNRLGLELKPVGKFIESADVVATERKPERVLFVNPSPAKGVFWTIALALWFERRRPDIVFEVVETRGSWSDALRSVTTALGNARDRLDNVVVTPSTRDMRPVYGRARLLLAPSLWWESGARVLAEAMLNGIPAITTDSGGAREMIQDGGILVKLSERFHEPPHNLVPSEADLVQLATLIESLFDDRARYDALARAALGVGQRIHRPEVSTARLINALAPLVASDGG